MASEDINDSMKKMRELFLKTEQMKEASKQKHVELLEQISALKQRLNKNSMFLGEIRSCVNSMSFTSRTTELWDMNAISSNREETNNKIVEIKQQIEQLRSRMTDMGKTEAQNYQKAFQDVVESFENAAKSK